MASAGQRDASTASVGHRFGVAAAAAALCLALVAALVLAIVTGPAGITPSELWHIISERITGADPTVSPIRSGIVWELRMPRALTAAAVGAGLALSGAVMQATTRNPLAEPYLLGLSSGASLAAVSTILLGAAVAVTALLPFAAFVGALIALAATLLIAGRSGGSPAVSTVLAGIAVSAMFSALTSFVIFWSATGDSYREILGWLLGTLGASTWISVSIAMAALLLIGVPLAASGRVLDAFTFGDKAAAGLGVNVRRTRLLLLLAVALLTGAMVSVSGAIGFVGLVLPHAVRIVMGPGNRILLPLAAIAGAAFLVLADTLARTVFAPRELPVGVVTAIVGAPVFALLLMRGANRNGTAS